MTLNFIPSFFFTSTLALAILMPETITVILPLNTVSQVRPFRSLCYSYFLDLSISNVDFLHIGVDTTFLILV